MSVDETVSRLESTAFARTAVGTLGCLLAGVGAVGSEIARLLGQIGVGEVGLVDPDQVEPVNAPHSVFFRDPRWVGRSKPEGVAEQAGALFPSTRWTAFPCEIADLPLAAAERFDLVFAAADSPSARMETAYVARRLRRPMVDAALMGESWWRGRVSWFPPAFSSACYLCGFAERARAELLRAAGSTAPGCSRRLPGRELASTPVLGSVIAGLAVDAGVRGLLGSGENGDSGSYAVEVRLEGSGSRIQTHELTRSVGCPWHDGELGGALQRVRLDRPTLREAMVEQGIAALALEWPVVFRARCLVCGKETARPERVGRFERSAACAACGAARMLPLEAAAVIQREDALAERSPGELGLSDPWLGTVQTTALRFEKALGEPEAGVEKAE